MLKKDPQVVSIRPNSVPLLDAEGGDAATADLAPGDPAFDFERPLLDFSDGTERATGETFRLSEASKNRPVALIFGSYT